MSGKILVALLENTIRKYEPYSGPLAPFDLPHICLFFQAPPRAMAVLSIRVKKLSLKQNLVIFVPYYPMGKRSMTS